MIRVLAIIIGTAVIIFVITLVAALLFVFYLMCIDEDNCTACKGQELGECMSCIVYKHKLKRGDI